MGAEAADFAWFAVASEGAVGFEGTGVGEEHYSEGR